MPTDAAPAFLSGAIAETKASQPPPDLAALRAKAADVRDLKQEEGDLEQRLADVQARITKAESEELPDLMGQLGLDRLDLEPEGNNPGMTFQCGPFYRANIAASWPQDKRAAAFDYLDAEGAGDLVKVSVSLTFAKGERERADSALDMLRKAGLTPDVKLDVPHATLTAWVKEQVEKFSRMPKLDLIGGQVGRVVRIKPTKTKD